MLARGRPAVEQPAARHADSGRGEHRLGLVLLHGERRGQHAGVRIGNAQDLEDSLHGPVLADAPVQRVQRDVRLEAGEDVGDVTPDVDRRDPVAFGLERPGAGRARPQ